MKKMEEIVELLHGVGVEEAMHHGASGRHGDKKIAFRRCKKVIRIEIRCRRSHGAAIRVGNEQ